MKRERPEAYRWAGWGGRLVVCRTDHGGYIKTPYWMKWLARGGLSTRTSASKAVMVMGEVSR